MEIRRSYNHLISRMGFPILVRWHLYIESGPWSLYLGLRIFSDYTETFSVWGWPLYCAIKYVHSFGLFWFVLLILSLTTWSVLMNSWDWFTHQHSSDQFLPLDDLKSLAVHAQHHLELSATCIRVNFQISNLHKFGDSFTTDMIKPLRQ